jgi:protein-S-isoprenylcysteine O-methyltransferase Ste14
MERERKNDVFWTGLKTLIFTALVPGTVTVLIPFRLLSSQPEAERLHSFPPQLLGVLAMSLGALGGSWCFWLFVAKGKGTPAPIDPPKHLVVAGPYRHVRNPMYVAVTIILLGESAFFCSNTLLVYAGLCFVAFNLFVRFYEEPALRKKFGPAYEEHCRNVPRWIPGSRKVTGRDEPPR